jgi:hypothetical protein
MIADEIAIGIEHGLPPDVAARTIDGTVRIISAISGIIAVGIGVCGTGS